MIGFSAWIFTVTLGFYTICSLQWYSYKVERALFHCAKPKWHLYFALAPFVLFVLVLALLPKLSLIIAIAYAGLIIYWQFKMATKLVMTERTTRYFLLLAFVSILCLFGGGKKWYLLAPAIIIAVVLSVYISAFVEKKLGKKYIQKAKEKLDAMPNLKIVLITASYGKTSIKNYLKTLLDESYKTYASPRSVNTLMGLAADINDNLADNTQIYIAEAGARAKGDIAEITEFLNPHCVIIGQIGDAHIEYFKSIDAVRATKLEALQSTRLERIVAHSSTGLSDDEKCVIYDKNVKNVKASLDALSFELKIAKDNFGFEIPKLLGEFNAANVAAAALMASYLGLNATQIDARSKHIKNAEHRLNRMDNAGKIIIDDGFNGNFEGMSASYRLCATYNGSKVLVTPGIIEGQKGINAKLAKVADGIFETVIITSALNAAELKSELKHAKVIELKHKSELVAALAKHTKAGDLVLFSNDAPQHI